MTDKPGGGVRRDRLLGGRIVLAQPATGHRAGTDAVLLAAAGPPAFGGTALDFGSGVGTVGIAFAVRCPLARLRLIEVDPDLAALASENIAANGLAGRAEAMTLDILAPASERHAGGLRPGEAGLVLTNPPFDSAARGRGSPDPARRRAHVMEEKGFSRWFGAAADALGNRGVLVAILRADALPEMLMALERRFGGVTLLPVHPRADAPAGRLLVRACKGSRAPLTLLPGLILHGDDGAFTPDAAALHRGEAALADVCPGW